MRKNPKLREQNSKSFRNAGFLTLYPPDRSPPAAVGFSSQAPNGNPVDEISYAYPENSDGHEHEQIPTTMPTFQDYDNKECISIGGMELNDFSSRNRALKVRSKDRPKSTNISSILEHWNESEITQSFEGLPTIEKYILTACWRGEMDKVYDAVTNQCKSGSAVTTQLVNAKDTKGRTCLHFASAFGHSQIVQFLIQQGANVNAWDKINTATPLICAAACGSKPVIEILLSHKAEVNAGLNSSLTPLHWSIQANSEECVKKLLDSGASLNSYHIDIGTPLHLASSLGNENIIKLLIQKGAEVSLCKGKELWTPLHIAVNEGCSESVIEIFIQAGANIQAKDAKEQTVLHLAAGNLDYELLEVLLSYPKADANGRDCDGRAPIHKSISKDIRSVDCIVALIENGADLNIQDKYGYSPLHLAAIQDSPHCAASLLQQGADVTLRTKAGQSGLSLLVKKMPHVIKYIRETLDNAVSISMNNVDDPELELRLDFKAMVANPSNVNTKSCRDRENFTTPGSIKNFSCEDIQRETEFLTCLINTGHKSYLSHPLIEAFIVLKWQKVRIFFWISFLCYIIMVSFYTLYVYTVYVRECPFHFSVNSNTSAFKSNLICKKTNETGTIGPVYCDLSNNVILKIVWFSLTLVSILMIIKEIFKIIQGLRTYFGLFENYMQWLLLSTIIISVWPVPTSALCLAYWHYPSAAVGIFIAWSMMLFRIGRFPELGIYVQMLGKVIKNFGLFISAYACLLIAFALSFCVLFPEEPSFASFHFSILKVLTMMVGELDYEDLFYKEKVGNSEWKTEQARELYYPITVHIMFAIFVLLVTIVLMNLLVGLAVHDIQSLEKGAKLDRLLRQISSISGLESFLFSKGLHALLPDSIGARLRNRALLVPSSYKWIFYFKPNDPRDKRLPKDLRREALRLASSRQHQQISKVPSRSHKTFLSKAYNQSQFEELKKFFEVELKGLEQRIIQSSQVRQNKSGN